MDRVEHIERYLRAQLSADRVGAVPAVRPQSRFFITISRQSGSGAHAVAESMVEAFASHDDTETFGRWVVYDRSICEIVASDPAFSDSLDSLIEEEYRAPANDFFHQLFRATAHQSMVIDRVFLVVRTIAAMGKVIIIGRGGSHVTRDMPLGVSMRLVATEQDRLAAAMHRYGLSERQARADIKGRDASRYRMMKDRFNVDIADPGGYDVTWNVGTTTSSQISAGIAAVISDRAGNGRPS